MQFLVFSDSHGRYDLMAQAVRRLAAVRHILFLGDGLADLEHLHETFPAHTIRAVRGNMDGLVHHIPDEDYFDLFSCRVMMLHGHRHAVKGGTAAAEGHALHAGARVLLYGHTHCPENRYLSDVGLYVFNPGSIGRPYDGRSSFGLLDILPDGSVMLSHGII